MRHPSGGDARGGRRGGDAREHGRDRDRGCDRDRDDRGYAELELLPKQDSRLRLAQKEEQQGDRPPTQPPFLRIQGGRLRKAFAHR